MGDTEKAVGAFNRTITTVRIGERLRSALVLTLHLVESIGFVGELTDAESDLSPELLLAVEQATTLAETLDRALATAMIQNDVEIEKLMREDDDDAQS